MTTQNKMLNWGGGQFRQARREARFHPRRTPRRYRNHRDVNRSTLARRAGSKRSGKEDAMLESSEANGIGGT